MQLKGSHTFKSLLLLCNCLNNNSSASHPAEEGDIERCGNITRIIPDLQALWTCYHFCLFIYTQF